MEFECLEFRWEDRVPDRARRVSTWLAENGYQSLLDDWTETASRYLPAHEAPAGPVRSEPRTVDVLIPPADPPSRVLVCERSEDGQVVTVLAVGRTAKEARRHHTAVKLVLDAKAPADEAWQGYRVEENGRERARRFHEEWLPRLGLGGLEGAGPFGAAPARPLAAAEALFAIHASPPVLGRPGLFRSRLGRAPDHPRALLEPGLLDGLAGEGLLDKAFVLVCRASGQVVGLGKDPGEIHVAMQLALLCPHCRSPLGEEAQDVLYSLTADGEEFLRTTRWIRGALEASLRARGCDPVVLLEDGAAHQVDGTAWFHDTAILIRIGGDLRAFQDVLEGITGSDPRVSVHGVYVAASPPTPTPGERPCRVLDVGQLEPGLDQLLEEIKREHFLRLVGAVVDVPPFDPRVLLGPWTR